MKAARRSFVASMLAISSAWVWMYRSGQSFNYIAGTRNEPSVHTSWSLPREKSAILANADSLPPSASTSG